MGASGGGKSSILSLLQHFYEPCRGEITVDGIAVREYKHGFLHRAMSTVSQEPAVFARKIAENITYGMDNDEVGCYWNLLIYRIRYHLTVQSG